MTCTKRLQRYSFWNCLIGPSLVSSLQLTMQERLSIIYVGDSEADEFAIRMLKGVAFTFRVTNEDSEAITKTSADYWIAGEEGLSNLTGECVSHSC